MSVCSWQRNNTKEETKLEKKDEKRKEFSSNHGTALCRLDYYCWKTWCAIINSATKFCCLIGCPTLVMMNSLQHQGQMTGVFFPELGQWPWLVSPFLLKFCCKKKKSSRGNLNQHWVNVLLHTPIRSYRGKKKYCVLFCFLWLCCKIWVFRIVKTSLVS